MFSTPEYHAVVWQDSRVSRLELIPSSLPGNNIASSPRSPIREGEAEFLVSFCVQEWRTTAATGAGTLHARNMRIGAVENVLQLAVQTDK